MNGLVPEVINTEPRDQHEIAKELII